MHRQTISERELNSWMTQQLSAQGIRNGSQMLMKARLEREDSSGCNWSEDVSVSQGFNTRQEYTETIVPAARDIVEQARRKFNVQAPASGGGFYGEQGDVDPLGDFGRAQHTREQHDEMIAAMRAVSNAFYAAAVRIGNHPFIEFTGLMNEYIDACRDASAQGIDFTQCNTHTGQHLPLKSFQVDYINEKLECIFTGRSVVNRIGD